MKQFFYLFLTVISVTACAHKDGRFTVSGKIKNVSSGTLVLQKLSYQSADFKTIDSSVIDKDGNYKLSGLDSQQNLYVLSYKNNPDVILINDTKDISIDFDPTGFHYPDIKTSDATKQLYTFIKNFWQKDSVLAVTYQQLNVLNKNGSQDSATINQLQSNYTRQLHDLTSVITGFVKTSNNPAAVCFALDKARAAIAPDALYALVQDASMRFPAHSGIAIFKSQLTQAMQSQQDNGASTALLNQPAPDLTMDDVNGKKVSISSFKGKYLLVDFWASWCGPCRHENPNVVAAYNKFKNKNFDILGVSLDEDKQAWIGAIKHDNLSWTQMSDLKQWNSEAINVYHFDGIPFNVLIDPSGKIIAESLRGSELEQKLGEVLQ